MRVGMVAFGVACVVIAATAIVRILKEEAKR
jgi:hypothetical protein